MAFLQNMMARPSAASHATITSTTKLRALLMPLQVTLAVGSKKKLWSSPDIGVTKRHSIFRSKIWGLLSFALFASPPVAAQSATYGAAAGYYHTVGGSAPGTYATSEAGGSASATVSPANGGTIDVSATSLGAPDNYNGMVANGLIGYDIQFIGLSNISLPVRVQAHGYAQGSGAGYQADTSFSITGQHFNTVGANAETSINDPFVSFNFDQIVSFSSNTSYHVQLYASASAEFRNGGGTASAFVDPVFTIDPAYANNFTIVGVPGQTNAVPEPAAWALMMVGFGLTGGVMRRRRHNIACHSDGLFSAGSPKKLAA